MKRPIDDALKLDSALAAFLKTTNKFGWDALTQFSVKMQNAGWDIFMAFCFADFESWVKKNASTMVLSGSASPTSESASSEEMETAPEEKPAKLVLFFAAMVKSFLDCVFDQGRQRLSTNSLDNIVDHCENMREKFSQFIKRKHGIDDVDALITQDDMQAYIVVTLANKVLRATNVAIQEQEEKSCCCVSMGFFNVKSVFGKSESLIPPLTLAEWSGMLAIEGGAVTVSAKFNALSASLSSERRVADPILLNMLKSFGIVGADGRSTISVVRDVSSERSIAATVGDSTRTLSGLAFQ
jgi:hypothetical protein